MSSFRSWSQGELSKFLNCVVEETLLDYLMTIETEKDLEEYLRELVGEATGQAELFVKEFLRHWRLHSQSKTTPPLENEGGVMRELPRLTQDQMVLFAKGSKMDTRSPPGFKGSPRGGREVQPVAPPLQGGEATPARLQGDGGKSHSKQTYVPLMSTEGQSRVSTRLPGRHPCQCLAQRHQLVNNCVLCGRIVCSQEGPGPCLFCGAFVCTPEQEEWMLKDSKKARKFREQLLKEHNLEAGSRPLDHIQASNGSENLHRAQQHRNKLLEFDQTSASRTRVIDDESDYFSVDGNRWLSVEEREALRNKDVALREEKYGSHRSKAVSLDIAGRKVIEEDTVVDLYAEKHAQDALAGSKAKAGSGCGGANEVIITHAGALYNTEIPTERPQFVESKRRKPKKSKHTSFEEESVVEKPKKHMGVASTRLQDKALQEMRDDGYCLSMHQPWATLLVLGIKRCEGRTWYSSHRGRLWIAATRQKPSDEEISQVQDFYVALYGGERRSIFFPSDYPTGCLLGCVDMLDCLSQEEYRERYPSGESESEYVFLVENPQELTLKFPIQGQHKIWKLGKDVHLAAKGGLKRS